MSFFPRRFFRSGALLTLALAMLFLAGCEASTGPQTTFVPQGSSSQAIYDLYKVFAIASIVVFVLVEGMLVYSAFRFRRRPEDGIPLQIHGNKPIEIAWTIAPALLVLFLATYTFRTQSILAQPGQNPLRVTVIGHQWWWEFRYPDYKVVTANELYLPANRDIQFSIEGADVIHSFWIPRLAGKTDAIPGQINTLTVRTQDTAQPLVMRGQCAEFCGGTHAQMGMYAVVEPQARFDAWIKQQQTPAKPPAGVTQPSAAPAAAGATATAAGALATAQPSTATAAAPVVAAGAGLEAQGYALFTSKGCAVCHAINGYPGANGLIGPNLTHVGSRRNIVAGWLTNTPENLQRWLRDPNEVKPGNIMGGAIKRGTLNEDEIKALMAYLQSLK